MKHEREYLILKEYLLMINDKFLKICPHIVIEIQLK
jgi:hypothetical protein